MLRRMDAKDTALSAAKEFINFLNKSPSPYHAVDESRRLLLSNGFKEIKESDPWDVKPLDKLFFTRNQSSLIAFAVGGQFEPGNGFSMIGTHTDSPCLKVKPVSKVCKQGYLQVGVQLYGGGIWHTWFDRDLKLAGRVIVKDKSAGLVHKLVHINQPIMRIPNIAIHLHREQNEKFEFNKETHLAPVIATVVKDQLENPGQTTEAHDKHHPSFLKVIAKDLKVEPADIIDFELCLADHVPATLGGLYEEFIFSGRLDNLHSSYCALKGFIDSSSNVTSLKEDTNIRMLSMFDNEEVGSESAQGAASAIQEHTLRRLSRSLNKLNSFEEAIPKSLMVSADMAHAVHPNFSEKHEEHHRPAFHKGVTLKFNANQRYASTAITSAIMREIAKEAEVPLQDFVTRNDSPCGSTIGPIISAKLGIPTLDLGSVQLSMHSIREMCCTSSVQQAVTLFKAFYEKYPALFAKTKGI